MMRSKSLLFFGHWQNSQHKKSICAANDRNRNSRRGAIIESKVTGLWDRIKDSELSNLIFRTQRVLS